jgi:hypothetical protein
MHDMDGPTIANEIYSALFKDDVLDPDCVAVALDAAVRKLRAKGLPPSRWALYVHIGM